MLTAYYDRTCDSKSLFAKYNIAKSESFEKYINKFDVIQLDMAYICTIVSNSKDTVKYIHNCVIEELKEIYPNILNDDVTKMQVALANINASTGAQFVIIIDEWDAMFRNDKYNEETQRDYVDLLRGLFKGEQSKSFTKLAYLTGILPIKKYSSESSLNNFDEFTMTSPKMLSEYVGFTQDEVQALCQKYDMDFEEAQKWYDGYSFRRISHIYSPNSIVKAMLSGEYSNYWTGTTAYESLKNYICMNFDGLKDDIVYMMSGGRCKVDVMTFENDMTSIKAKDDVLTVLIHLGYLAYDQINKEAYVPNEEVRSAFAATVTRTDWTPVIEAMKKSERLLKLTWNKEADEVAECISEVHMNNTSILQYNDENSLSCVITLAYYNAINDYTVIRELPSGLGFADIVFLPRKHSDKPAMVVELKYKQNAKAAIEQIKEKKYMKSLEEYKGNILLVGINYDKATKQHTCVIEDYKIT
jgi:ribosomal protein S8